ncbi:MAG TPA: MlaD family protein [Flavipsychrobacter sp.]
MQLKAKKRGWLSLAIVLIAVAGYFVYKYAYLVYQEYDYYAYYDDIHALQIANPVFISGVKVGEVSDIRLNGGEKVRVTLSIDKETKLTKGTMAVLASNNLRGDKMVFLELGNSQELLGHKSILIGEYDTNVMDMSDQVSPIIESAKYILNTADKNFSVFNRKVDNGLIEKTQKDIRGIERSMKQYNAQLTKIEASAGNAINTIKKLRESTDAARNNRGQVTQAINNAEKITADLASTSFYSQTDSLRTSVHKIKTQTDAVENSALGRELLEKDKTYTDLEKATKDLQRQVDKMKENAD